MFYLVLYLAANSGNSAIAIMPEKYETSEACFVAGKHFNGEYPKRLTACVPAPKLECKQFGKYCIYPNGEK